MTADQVVPRRVGDEFDGAPAVVGPSVSDDPSLLRVVETTIEGEILREIEISTTDNTLQAIPLLNPAQCWALATVGFLG